MGWKTNIGGRSKHHIGAADVGLSLDGVSDNLGMSDFQLTLPTRMVRRPQCPVEDVDSLKTPGHHRISSL